MSEWTDRRERNRSHRYIERKQQEQEQQQMPTLKETREKNKQNPIIDTKKANISEGVQRGKFITACINAYLQGDEERFNLYSDRIQAIVKKLYENAKENSSNMQELLNRVEGKVRDEIHVDYTVAKHIPDQDKQKEIISKYMKEKQEKAYQDREKIVQ